MAVDVKNLIAAINPDLFCDASVRTEVKELTKTKGYLAGAEKAKLPDIAYMDLIDIKYKTPISAPGMKAPIEKHTLIYDNINEGAEHIYFWILDKLGDIGFKKVDKLVDSFVAAPGSGHFSEQGAKAGRMQDEASKWLGAANQVVKSILNILYDLKEFQMRLALYEQWNSKDKVQKENALIALKQVWLDTVDIKRGNTGLKSLAFSQQGAFVTLIDAFMAVQNEALTLETKGKTEEIDLNDRVKRMLKQKVTEFFVWLKESERELRKRYEVEKTYLRSQVNTVQLYARWAKPYLKAAQALAQTGTPSAALVTSFNTSLLELVILAQSNYDPADDIVAGNLPKLFKTTKLRTYTALILIEFKYRTAPERLQQGGYGFRGKTEVSFTSFALNEDELKLLKTELEKDDLGDVMRLIEGTTTDSLETLREDLMKYLGEDFFKVKKEEKKEEKPEQTFVEALSSFFKTPEKKENKEPGIKKDSDLEKVLRSQALIDARQRCYLIYDLYKKSHRMASLPGHA